MQQDQPPLPQQPEAQGEVPPRQEEQSGSREGPPLAAPAAPPSEQKQATEPQAEQKAPQPEGKTPEAEKSQPGQKGAPPHGQRGQRGDRRGPRGQRDRRPGGRDRREGRTHYQSWSKPDFVARAVEGGIDRQFIESAYEFARAVGSNLSSNHFRFIHGEVMRQELAGFDAERFLLLKPRLAYLAARAGRAEMRDLRTILDRGVEKVCAEGIADEERQARFDRFSRCLEAILAYHRAYERKQGERI